MKPIYYLSISILIMVLFTSLTQAQTDTDKRLEFLKAVLNGDVGQVKLMLKDDPKLAAATNKRGVSAVSLAAYSGQLGVVTILLNTGIELNVFEAAATGQTERLKALIAEDRRVVNSYSVDGFFPLGLATFLGHADTVDALLAAGADVKMASIDSMRVTALHSAVAAKQLELGRKLIVAGADVNAPAENDFRALHEAAANGDLEFAKMLLDHGAEINVVTKDGKTPLAYAQERKRDEMITFLRAHGAH